MKREVEQLVSDEKVLVHQVDVKTNNLKKTWIAGDSDFITNFQKRKAQDESGETISKEKKLNKKKKEEEYLIELPRLENKLEDNKVLFDVPKANNESGCSSASAIIKNSSQVAASPFSGQSVAPSPPITSNEFSPFSRIQSINRPIYTSVMLSPNFGLPRPIYPLNGPMIAFNNYLYGYNGVNGGFNNYYGNAYAQLAMQSVPSSYSNVTILNLAKP